MAQNLKTKSKKKQLHLLRSVVKVLGHSICQKVAQNFKIFEKKNQNLSLRKKTTTKLLRQIDNTT